MALTVGTNTYVTLSEAETYADERDHLSTGWDTKTDDEKEFALLISARVLDLSYQWKGSITDDTTPQDLAWPRQDVFDKENRELDKDTVPQRIKDAQVELAFQWVVSDQMTPPETAYTRDDTNNLRGGIKREKLEGLEREYHSGDRSYLFAIAAGFAATQKLYPYVDLLVSDLVIGSPSGIFSRTVI